MTRRVAVIATGGTIACTTDPDGYAAKTLRAADLLARLPRLGGPLAAGLGDVELTPIDHGLLSSWDLGPPAMLQIARAVEAALGDHAGVVVTHGTDTLEETAALLSLAIGSDAAVVLTGAMRRADEPGEDGSANLLAAIRVAADPAAAGRGTLVVLGDTVHRGLDATKRHSSNPAAFGAPFAGPVGWVDNGTVAWRVPAGRRTTYRVAHADAVVPLLFLAAGQPVSVLRGALAGADGLVLAGTGLGHVPAAWMPVLSEAVAGGLPVVVCRRSPAGPTAAVYRGAGGGVDLTGIGVLPGGYRSPYAARMELICTLGAGLDAAELRAAFANPLP